MASAVVLHPTGGGGGEENDNEDDRSSLVRSMDFFRVHEDRRWC
jgi:hypothetical protein